MSIGSYGVIFLVLLMSFMVAMGFIAMGNTTFVVGSAADSDQTQWDSSMRTLVLFNTNFSPLAGILCAGYFLHTGSLSIVRASKNPENTKRDMFIGYLLVFITYIFCGCLGYIGFSGSKFADYFVGLEMNPGPGTSPNQID